MPFKMPFNTLFEAGLQGLQVQGLQVLSTALQSPLNSTSNALFMFFTVALGQQLVKNHLVSWPDMQGSQCMMTKCLSTLFGTKRLMGSMREACSRGLLVGVSV